MASKYSCSGKSSESKDPCPITRDIRERKNLIALSLASERERCEMLFLTLLSISAKLEEGKEEAEKNEQCMRKKREVNLRLIEAIGQKDRVPAKVERSASRHNCPLQRKKRHSPLSPMLSNKKKGKNLRAPSKHDGLASRTS